MRWLEIIELRSTSLKGIHNGIDIDSLIGAVPYDERPCRITVFESSMINTDFSIHLLFIDREVRRHGSKLGIRAAKLLREHGLVNHKIWTESRMIHLEQTHTPPNGEKK